MKSAKRLLRENVNTDGSLSIDKFSRALLSHRNTPDPDTGVSPAQVLFGSQSNPAQQVQAAGGLEAGHGGQREGVEDQVYCKKWSEHTKELPKLVVGESVLIQNQRGSPKQARR